jgi:hypothetical protein
MLVLFAHTVVCLQQRLTATTSHHCEGSQNINKLNLELVQFIEISIILTTTFLDLGLT